jgi:endonuclease YncB( thermonuclease family)
MTRILLALPFLLSADSLIGNVVKVTDGDTITVQVNNEQINVRLSEIDAPEHGQDFGQKSKDALGNLVFGKEVRVVAHGKDRYGRTIGDVIVGQTNVNEKLVEDGWAWNFLKYSKSKKLAELEKAAREAKKGLWAGIAPMSPWDYRAEQARKRAERKAKGR